MLGASRQIAPLPAAARAPDREDSRLDAAHQWPHQGSRSTPAARASMAKTRTKPDRLGGSGAAALPGLVVRAYGKFFDVQLRDEQRSLLSTVKGTLKREHRKTDLVAVGDRVWV